MMLRLAVSIAALGAGQAGPSVARAAVQAESTSVAHLERELARRPRDARLYLELAREYERLARRDKAEATLRTGTAEVWETRMLRAALIDLLARSERWDDAVTEAAPIAKDSSGRSIMARLQVNAGLAAYRARDRARARARWEAALVTDSTIVEGAVNLAALLLEEGKRTTARSVVSRALRVHPTDARLLALRARTLDGPEALAAALKALQQRRANNPADEAAGLELAGLFAASGNRLAAMALYDTLVHGPRASERAFTAATTFWMDGGDLKNAAAIAQRSLGQHPRSATLHALLGEVEATRSEWKAAAEAYRSAVRLARDLATREKLELELLDAYVAGGDTTYGIRLATQLADRPASRHTLLQAAQRVAAGLRTTSLADSIYGDLLGRDSLDLDALEAGAEIAEASGDTAKAIALYRRAVAIDSSGPAAPLALLRLTRASPDTVNVMLRRAVWRGVETLQRLEVAVTAAAGGEGGRVTLRTLARMRPEVERKNRVLAMLRSALDTVVFHTQWGRGELSQLRLAYPYSALLERYAADLAVADGGPSDSIALAGYDRLLRRDPSSAEIHLKRADLLARNGRTAEAIDAYTRALDLQPESDAAYRALRELRQRNGTLELLLAQVRRLRIRLPDSRTVADHEIEVLQRLGRLAEAQAVADKLLKRKP